MKRGAVPGMEGQGQLAVDCRLSFEGVWMFGHHVGAMWAEGENAMRHLHPSPTCLVIWMARHAGTHQSSWGLMAKGAPGGTYLSHLDLPGGGEDGVAGAGGLRGPQGKASQGQTGHGGAGGHQPWGSAALP